MTVRGATLFAILGTALWTIHLILHVITNLSGLSGGFVSLNAFLGSLVDFLAAVSLLVSLLCFISRGNRRARRARLPIARRFSNLPHIHESKMSC